jgi:hypothetical protein
MTFIKSQGLCPVYYRNEMHNIFAASGELLFELTANSVDRLNMECGVSVN